MNKKKRVLDSSDDLQARVVAEIPHLRRYARALLSRGHVDQADDLVQACLEKALRSIDSWRGRSNMRAWLFAIMHNLFVSELRKRRPAITLLGQEDLDVGLSAFQADSQVTLRGLAEALHELPSEQYEIILMVGLEGLSYQEVAEALQIPIGTVRSRLSRGRETLRKRLAYADAPAAEDVR